MEWASGRRVTPCSPVKASPVATTSTHGKRNSSPSDSGLPHNPKEDRPQTLRIGGFQSSSTDLPRLSAARIRSSASSRQALRRGKQHNWGPSPTYSEND